MHIIEKNLRKYLQLAVEIISKFPVKFSTPLLSALSDFPTWIARSRGMAAATTYWQPVKTDNPATFKIVEPVGILIQGPLATNKDAAQVAETVEIYNSIFPTAKVVLSTWENSKKFVRKHAIEERCKVVFSRDPGKSFPTNLDRQALSTEAGLLALKELGVEFTLKTRVDHRITAPSSLQYLLQLWQSFPSDTRIIASSYGTGRFRIYGWTEQLQFARTESLLHYWEALPSTTLHKIKFRDPLCTELAKLGVAVHETRLNVRYLSRVHESPTWTWSDHLTMFSKHFGIADSGYLQHVQLGRPRTVMDHVYPWNDIGTNEIEQHSSFGDWLLALNDSFSCLAPTSETLLKAMKVPDSDLVALDTLLVNPGKNITPKIP